MEDNRIDYSSDAWQWVNELKNSKQTDSALLIGSGASLDYLPYSEISKMYAKTSYVIAVNELHDDKAITFDYCISHHTAKDLPDHYLNTLQDAILKHPGKFVLSEYDCNNPQRGATNFKGQFYKYKGLPVCESTNLYVDPIINKQENLLFVGGSILFDSIGLGLHLGVKHFYLLGFDGGKYENHCYYSGYRKIWPEDYYFVEGHSIRTMNSFKALQEWIRPYGATFTHLSARYGSSDLKATDWDNWQYQVICQ